MFPKSSSLCDKQSVEQQIYATKGKIRDLQDELYGLYERLNASNSVLSIFPLEILTEIFVCAARHDENENETASHLPMPFLIGRVCRGWRKIALETPQLWRTLCITFSPSRVDTQMQLVSEWVARLGSHPLHLKLSFVRNWNPPLALFLCLLDSSTQWRSLEITGVLNHIDCFPLQLNATQYDFPLLSSLFISTYGSDGLPATEGQPRWDFRSSPQLRCVRLYGLHPSFLSVDWNRLRDFRGHTDAHGCLSVLQQAPSLRSCHLTVTPAPTSQWNPTPWNPPNLRGGIRLLPQLTTLVVEGPDQSNSGQIRFDLFFQNVELPALTDLTLDLVNGGRLRLDVINMLQRSKCRLINLTLHDPNFTNDDLLWFLPQLPTLIRLSLIFNDLYFTEKILELLSPVATKVQAGLEPALVMCFPKLKHFQYRGSIDINFEPKRMLRLLKKRQEFAAKANSMEVQQLETVKIFYDNGDWANTRNPNVMRDFYQELGPLRTLGTDVEITYQARQDDSDESDESNSDSDSD